MRSFACITYHFCDSNLCPPSIAFCYHYHCAEEHCVISPCWMKKNDVAKMRQAGTAPATGTTIYCPTSLWCTVIYKLLALCTANIGDPPSTPPLTTQQLPRECFQSPAPVRRLSRTLSSPSRIAMTTNSPATTSSPTGPSASYTNISPEQLADLLSKVGQNHGPTPRFLATPRVGGKGPAGVWTGFRAGCKGTDPKSATCMRDFDTSVVKSFTAMAPIEDKCQMGLHDSPDLLFSMPNESNANMTVNSLIAFEERMTHHGLEGVFHVVSASGTTLNMFREPGMCTSDLIKTWCEDVITPLVCQLATLSATMIASM